MNDFYVYALLDIRKPGTYVYDEYTFSYEPFYIGKGRQRRCFEHLDQINSKSEMTHKANKIRKIFKETNQKPIIMKLKERLDEKTAFTLEIRMISKIGRLDLGVGPLTNLTNGGEGGSGRIETNETRLKKRNALLGRSGRKWTLSERKQISERMLGKNHFFYGKKRGSPSAETRLKISEANKGNLPWNAGRHLPEDMKTKISISMTGIKQSDETKEKKRQSAKLGWEKRRQKGSANGGRKSSALKH